MCPGFGQRIWSLLSRVENGLGLGPASEAEEVAGYHVQLLCLPLDADFCPWDLLVGVSGDPTGTSAHGLSAELLLSPCPK